jgi:creatinine amidohydrolase
MLYGNLRWIDIELLDKDDKVVICPLASLEQHGHHLPLLTDTHLVTAVAECVHKVHGENVLLMPTLWLGASDHHMDFPGTVTVSNEDYADIIKSIVASLVSAGFWKILFLNGHGGNVAPGEVAITQMADDSHECNESYIVLASYWSVAADSMAAEKHGMQQPSLSHACEYETSMMLHLHRDLVMMDQAVGYQEGDPDFPPGIRVAGRFNMKSETGALGTPELATVEKGESLLRAVTADVSALVEQMIDWPVREVLGPVDPA